MDRLEEEEEKEEEKEEEVRRCRARVPVSGFSRSDSRIGLTLSGPCWCTWLGGALGALGALLGGARALVSLAE